MKHKHKHKAAAANVLKLVIPAVLAEKPGPHWRTAQLIETDDAGSPQVAADAAGNALAVWQQSDGTRISIWANRYE
jgi:hypothetical protein